MRPLREVSVAADAALSNLSAAQAELAGVERLAGFLLERLRALLRPRRRGEDEKSECRRENRLDAHGSILSYSFLKSIR